LVAAIALYKKLTAVIILPVMAAWYNCSTSVRRKGSLIAIILPGPYLPFYKLLPFLIIAPALAVF
jgi:hypothetical protein